MQTRRGPLQALRPADFTPSLQYGKRDLSLHISPFRVCGRAVCVCVCVCVCVRARMFVCVCVLPGPVSPYPLISLPSLGFS